MKSWDSLPKSFQNEKVRPYYEQLKKHKMGLFVKRVMDVIIAFVLLIILIPLLLMISMLIMCTSSGGILFCQRRVTRYGKIFTIYKFRTMVKDAQKLGSQVTTKNDVRVTKIGHFLRKIRLDELPQLLNILKGDMSLVGTRPEVEKYVKSYSQEMMATLLLPAGVTSKASIFYKDEEKHLSTTVDVDQVYVDEIMPEKMKYNLDYVKNYSIFTDIKLLVKTVFAVWQ